MKNSSSDSRFDKLDKQIKRAKKKPIEQPSGASMALRMGSEMAAGVMVGAAFGFFVDKSLGTMPLFLVIFLFIGSAAGVRMMMQSSARFNQQNNDEEL